LLISRDLLLFCLCSFQKLCETLKTMPADQAYDLRFRSNPVTGDYSIRCFTDNLDTFLKVWYT